jgi:hypothetical protein
MYLHLLNQARCRLKKVSHQTWNVLWTRLASTLAVFNILVLWDGLPVDEDGNLQFSIHYRTENLNMRANA